LNKRDIRWWRNSGLIIREGVILLCSSKRTVNSYHSTWNIRIIWIVWRLCKSIARCVIYIRETFILRTLANKEEFKSAVNPTYDTRIHTHEKRKTNSPCTEYQDHLHQKSYGGPPIHRVIQILATINTKRSI
jgi:hypothetical protein